MSCNISYKKSIFVPSREVQLETSFSFFFDFLIFLYIFCLSFFPSFNEKCIFKMFSCFPAFFFFTFFLVFVFASFLFFILIFLKVAAWTQKV